MTSPARVELIVARGAVGAAMLAPLGMRWMTRGNGSTFSGAKLASTLLHAEPVGAWGRIGGVAIFAAGLVGAGCLGLAPFRAAAVDRWFVGVGTSVVGVLIAVAIAGRPGPERWGAGLIVLAAGGALAIAAGATGMVLHRPSPGRPGRPTQVVPSRASGRASGRAPARSPARSSRPSRRASTRPSPERLP